MKTLVLFTSYYPYNRYETYLEAEINYLNRTFDEIHIISNEQDLSLMRITPPNVKSYSMPYNIGFPGKILSCLGLFSAEFWSEIKFIRKQYKQKITFQKVSTMLQSLYKVNKMRKAIAELIPGIFSKVDLTMYSYWASDNAVALAFFKKSFPHIKTVTRAHRWDVYFDKKGSDYLPFRKLLAKNLDRIYFISDHAKNYFIDKTGLNKNSFKVSRLGVASFHSPAHKENPDAYHLVSCSYPEARKRVDLIAKALDNMPEQYIVKWTHIGDGTLMPELRELTAGIIKRKKNISIDLKGMMSPAQVKSFYEQNYVDLFINVSESEGVPVSIMEAFSASVPALATDADGTVEIVVHKVNGLLIECDFAPAELATSIQQYLDLPDDVKAVFRSNARKMYLEKFNEADNYNDFTASLLNIS